MNKSNIFDSKIMFSSSGYFFKKKLCNDNEIKALRYRIQDGRQNILLSSYVTVLIK